MDERYLNHRLRSTSLAGIAGALALAGLFLWHQIVSGEIRTELLLVLVLMAVVKLGYLLILRLTN